MIFLRSFIGAAFLALTASVFSGEVTSIPDSEKERLELNTEFYQKYLSFRGFPIVASEKVSDYAFYEAAYLMEKMLGDRQDLLDAMTEQKIRLAIMAPSEYTTDIPEHSDLEPKSYWDRRARGLGATKIRPAVSVGEENLLGYRGDPYAAESIFVHEFAHVIHEMGIRNIDPGFQKRLELVFGRAALKGLWRGKYAGTNPSEYWAEGVQSWFDTNRENDFDHNHVNTREELKEHDPELASLIEEFLGDGQWRYKKPADREQALHLTGFDVNGSPTFEWSEELVAAYEAIERGEGYDSLPLAPMTQFDRDTILSASGPAVKLRLENQTKQRISFFWIGYDGNRRHYGDLDPGRKFTQRTYGSHVWVIVDENGGDYGWIQASDTDCRVVIE